MSDEIFTTRAPAVSYAERGVPPPAPLYIGPNETLVVNTWSSTAPAALAIVARVLTPEGQIHTSRWSHTPSTSRTQATTYHRLPEGCLLSLVVDANGAAYRRGHCWCQVGIQIGEGATGVPHAQLISDYVTGTARLAWPGGQLRSSVEGPGLISTVTGTNPVAGAEFTMTVPTGARWRLVSVYGYLTTNATVANRTVHLIVDNGSTSVCYVAAQTAQTASQDIEYTFGATLPSVATTAAASVNPLPEQLHLVAAYRIRTFTTNLQAGDDWGAPRVLVEEWIEP